MLRRTIVTLVAVMSIVAAAPAHAAVTQSNITAPASGSQFLITDANPATTVPVTGTSNGTTGDFVDINCYDRPDRSNGGPSNIAVQADGSFSANLSTDTAYGTCVLRAVPHDFPTTSDPSPFTGPTVTTEWIISSKVGGTGPNKDVVYDFYVEFQSANAMNDYVSATHGGLWDTRLQYGPASSSAYVWFENATLSGDERLSTDNRSRLQVDGRNAYGPHSANRLFPDNPGLPALTFDASRDLATGITTIHETDPIVVCPNESPFPPTSVSCPQFNSAGVRLDRTIVTDDNGAQVHIMDNWFSTDNASHTISAHYFETTDGSGPGDGSVPVGLKMPWFSPDFQTFSSETT